MINPPLTRLFYAACIASLTTSCATRSKSPVAGTPTLLPTAKHAGEGPAWNPVKRTLYYVGDDRISQMIEGHASRDFRRPVSGANGLLFDHQGRLLACEAGNRRVTRIDKNGVLTVLASKFEGKKFNSPNDLSIDSKDRIYFTDPRYGPRDTMEMRDAAGQLVEGVYRIDTSGAVQRILGRESVDRPNGLLVSPDDKFLYVADNNSEAGGTRKLWRFDLNSDGSANPQSRKLIFDWKTSRGPDGLKMDTQNRLFVAAGRTEARLPEETAKPYTGGIYILSLEGKLLDFVPIPNDEVTNCAFGGVDLKTLYITAGGTLWTLRVSEPGLVTFGK